MAFLMIFESYSIFFPIFLILLFSRFLSISLLVSIFTCFIGKFALILSWTNSILYYFFAFLQAFTGYSHSCFLNLAALWMTYLLDFVFWLSFLYADFYLSIMVELSTLFLFYILSFLFFISDDFIATLLLFEFQNIPLLLLILTRHSNPYLSSLSLSPLKGIGMAIYLLIFFGLISGLCLFFSFQQFYLLSSLHFLSYFLDYLSFSPECPSALFFLFVSGSMKLAIFPFHVWLSKVHVEASTIGSVLLAAIALKTGFYLHFLFLPYFKQFTTSLLLLPLFIGTFFSSASLFYQIDLKRWIALFSIAHMNLFYLISFGIFLANPFFFSYFFLSIVLFYGMFGHSLISAGLFFMIGFLLDLTSSKYNFDLPPFLQHFFLAFLFLFLLANSGFPSLFLWIFETFAFTVLLQFHLFLGIFCALASSSALLSSLLIFYKFFHNPFQLPSPSTFSYSPLFLLLLLTPLLAFLFLAGFQFLSPLHLLHL